MPNYWLVKTEPTTYSFDDLKHEGVATWDGVKNPVAMKHLRAMQAGDEVFIYHTGSEKAVIGTASVVAPGDPPKLRAKGRLARAVTLAEIKQDKAFADSPLVRIGRLSVMPVAPAQYQKLLKLGGAGV